MFVLAFDVGGTKVEAVLFRTHKNSNASGSPTFHLSKQETVSLEECGRKRIPTDRQQGYESLIGRMAQLAKDVCKEASVSLSDVTGLGFGLPGTVNPRTGTLILGNTLMMVGKNIGKDVATQLSFKGRVVNENDANLFAFAEALGGAGVQHQEKTKIAPYDITVVGIILGTGCGGGFVVNGKMLRGRRGGSAEVGHSVLYHDGAPCYCGRLGCAEQYLSGPGFEAAFGQRIYSQIKEAHPTAAQIFELREQGDPAAAAVVKKYQRDLARFLGKLTTIMDPDLFVLGGGMSRQEAIYEDISYELSRRSFLPDSQVPVYKPVLGDAAGVYGAALATLV